MRVKLINIFEEQIRTTFLTSKPIEVAVIGGNVLEPEIVSLENLGFKFNLTIIGIESFNGNYLVADLNDSWIDNESIKSKFNLVICSQVLEHIWSHENAFTNFAHILASNAYIWITCPTSNKFHLSPQFFSAGLTDNYLSLNLEKKNVFRVGSGTLGSWRYYRATHLIPGWLTLNGHRNPLIFAFETFSLHKRFLYIVRYFPHLLLIWWSSPKLGANSQNATETWYFGYKC